ncbi:hypothetical protein K505DRAFT_412889 [Melanomma pulvis-pyrius CBS 109.77]|uniref:Uncharacterized protein n=1 Tax=Melanomma pulvis-pyrius CBS 109.77 TaxID=1314802 RepID=A0A6A6XWG8_9PLEO|nr:hypothetical protein K505DRAFT_412889 [Melanomma pulvis-pyrius CBS 109.77]
MVQPKQALKIHSTPFKPSYLSIPPSPFTPLTPLPPFLPQKPAFVHPKPSSTAPLPHSPLRWLWTCHQCHRTYAIGVTRRCLDDGHFFCSGTTPTKNWRKAMNPRKTRRHRACVSEFDYVGWNTWGRWRRSGRRDSVVESSSSNPSSPWSSWSSSSSSSSSSASSSPSTERRETIDVPKKDCWNSCDYPSECRWGRQYGIHTPMSPVFTNLNHTPDSPTQPQSLESALQPENLNYVHTTITNDPSKKADKSDFWGGLLASATRRRSSRPSSPLGRSLADASREDVAMSSASPIPTPKPTSPFPPPASASPSPSYPSPSASAPTTLADIIHKTKTKTTRRCSQSNSKRARFVSPSPQRPDPVFDFSPAAAAVGEYDFGFDSARLDLSSGATASSDGLGFAPLERVRSRDSGHYSTEGYISAYGR